MRRKSQASCKTKSKSMGVLLKAKPQHAQQVQREVMMLRKDLAESREDASNAARQTQDRTALLAQVKKSEKVWQRDALAGRCSMCDEGVPKEQLLRCAPVVPASTLMLCPGC